MSNKDRPTYVPICWLPLFTVYSSTFQVISSKRPYTSLGVALLASSTFQALKNITKNMTLYIRCQLLVHWHVSEEGHQSVEEYLLSKHKTHSSEQQGKDMSWSPRRCCVWVPGGSHAGKSDKQVSFLKMVHHFAWMQWMRFEETWTPPRTWSLDCF